MTNRALEPLIALMPGLLFYYRCSVCCGEHFADLLHFPPDKLFREFRVMTGHIRIGVAENLCQYVDRHSVLDSKAGERMPGAMRRQRFVDIADYRDFFQITI